MSAAAKKYSLSLLTALLIWAGMTAALFKHPPGNILSWDTFGYHLYLPAILIHHDLGMRDTSWAQAAIDTYQSTGTLYQAREVEDGRWVMKYSMGMAVMWSPFFVVAHVIAGITGHPQDGFSAPYQWTLIIAAMIYLLIGLLLLRKVLLHYFSDAIASCTIALILLGTNLYHQYLYSTGMPHVFMFALIAGILWHSILWHREHARRDALIVGFLLGLLVLARPSLIVAGLIPLLIGVEDPGKVGAHLRELWGRRRQLYQAVAMAFVVVLPQLIYWKWLVGKWLYMSYNNPGEGFEFFHPYVWEMLFSFRKGWYIYTPLMLLATAGLFLLHRVVPTLRFAIIAFFLFNLYVVASWSCWWYADSFGSRALVDSYAVIAIPLAATLVWITQQRVAVRAIGILVVLALVALNQFQTWQSTQGIIHTSRMTRSAYEAGFGRTLKPTDLENLFLVERSYSDDLERFDRDKYIRRPLLTRSFDDVEPMEQGGLCDSVAFFGNGSFVLGSAREFSPAIQIPWDELTDRDHAWLHVSCYARGSVIDAMPRVSLVATFDHDGENYGYKASDISGETGPIDGWYKIELWYLTPEPRRPTDELLVYCWLRDTLPVLVDEITITLYEPMQTR